MSDSSKYNKRVQLQKRTMVDDKDVYYTDDIKTVWAHVEQIGSREAVQAGAVSMADTIRVSFWYRPFDAAEYRLKYAGAIYNIDGAIDVKGLREELELTCTKEPHPIEAVERPEGGMGD